MKAIELANLWKMAAQDTPIEYAAEYREQCINTAAELHRLASIEQKYMAIMALEPVAWQSRFTFPNKKWAECAKEHAELVVKNSCD